MSRYVILATMPDQSVAIVIPAPEAMGFMRRGGLAIDLEREIAKRCADPAWRSDWPATARADLARRFYETLRNGGISEIEAAALIGESDCPAHSTAWEVVDVAHVPPDRTYRDAWRRSPNGGPIYIDQQRARAIRDARRARAA